MFSFSLLGRFLSSSYCENLLARLFFFPSIYIILKSYSWIYTSYFIIKALGKLVAIQFSYIIKVFISILTVN